VSTRSFKIYCAGPLFNPKEREEMLQIANVIEESGYSVFLPQRDGLEFARLLPALVQRNVSVDNARNVLNHAIFCLDVFQVMNSHGLLLNMNGRVPDEGAMVEAGIAWAHNRVIVIYKSDDRSLVEGSCNPLVLGLSDFEYVTEYENIPSAFTVKFSDAIKEAALSCDPRFEVATQNGKEISTYLSGQRSESDIADLLLSLFRERSCQNSKDPKRNCSPANMQQ